MMAPKPQVMASRNDSEKISMLRLLATLPLYSDELELGARRADAYDVGRMQNLLAGHAPLVHERSMRAQIAHDELAVADRELAMRARDAARHVVDDDHAPVVDPRASDQQSLAVDRIGHAAIDDVRRRAGRGGAA